MAFFRPSLLVVLACLAAPAANAAAAHRAPATHAHHAEAAPDPHVGTVTGRKLPRFASLRADAVNFRIGPGHRYPIEWRYQRRGLPVEIEREFDNYRLVVAPDGTKGWVHEAMLMGRRDFIVIGGAHVMRASPSETGRPVAILDKGVVGRIRACKADAEWCRVRVGRRGGWLKRADLWGLLPGETVPSG